MSAATPARTSLPTSSRFRAGYEYIYFTNLVLDAGLRAGCARVHTATRIVFDEVFFTGFRTVGLCVPPLSATSVWQIWWS